MNVSECFCNILFLLVSFSFVITILGKSGSFSSFLSENPAERRSKSLPRYGSLYFGFSYLKVDPKRISVWRRLILPAIEPYKSESLRSSFDSSSTFGFWLPRSESLL